MWETLLLTWCIEPKWTILSKKEHDLVLEKRLKQYINAILHYITISDFENIVFCDNSNYNWEFFTHINSIAKNYNKNFEYITYDGNKNSWKYWYGYSECELIDYAFENSLFIQKSTNWYKITWRYILKDINKLISTTRNSNFYFHKQWIFDSFLTVSTSFFKINNTIYQELLYKKHTELYNMLYTKDYYNELLLNGSIPVEKIWYILLRDFLITHKKYINYSVSVYYIFPSTLPWFLNNCLWEYIRKLIYFMYYLCWWDKLFSISHLLYDRINFRNKYRNLISDKLI